jgi:hypothetical protein
MQVVAAHALDLQRRETLLGDVIERRSCWVRHLVRTVSAAVVAMCELLSVLY